MTQETEESTPKPKPTPLRRLLRLAGRLVVGLLLLVAAIFGMLYIPGVLNRIVGWVLPEVENASNLSISVGNIRLRFPVELTVEDALVLDLSADADTMVTARSVSASLNPLGLLRGELEITDARIADGVYKMGAPDSLFVRAGIDSVGARASISLDFSKITIARADLNGARVCLLMGTDTTEKPIDTVPTAPLRIISGPVRLKDVDYRMAMYATDDTIAVRVSEAQLSSGELLVSDTIDIQAERLTLAVDSALYGRRGAIPVAGLDPEWITLEDAAAQVDSFSMYGEALSVPLTFLTVGRVADMPLTASGLFEMDATQLRATGFEFLLDDKTRVSLTASMGLDSIAAPLSADASAEVYVSTVATALPALTPILAPLPSERPLRLRAVASGTMTNISVDTLAAYLEDVFEVKGAAVAANISDPERLSVDATLSGSLRNSAPIASLLPDGIKLPSLSLRGSARARGNNYSARLTAATRGGRLALDGTLAASAERYRVNLLADSFPVAAFMPDLGVGAVTASVSASGRSFNPLRRGATANADVLVRSAEFRGRRVGGVSLSANLAADGQLKALLSSEIPAANLTANLTATLEPKAVGWNLSSNIRRVDLQALGFSDSLAYTSLLLDSDGYAALNLDSLSAAATIRNADIAFGATVLTLDSLRLTADSGRETTLRIGDRSLNIDFNAPEPLTTLTDRFGKTAALVSAMVEQRNLETDSLVGAMPRFSLNLDARPGNVISRVMASAAGISVKTLNLSAARDSALRVSARTVGLGSGESFKTDTVNITLANQSNAMLLNASVHNNPGTLDEFAYVRFNSRIAGREAKFFLQQQNIQNRIGYRVGFSANVTDSLILINMDPITPIIAYKNWLINGDNYVAFNPTNFQTYANLDARGGDSRIQLLTSRSDNSHDNDSTASPNEIVLKVSDIHLQDWLKINPFAPPIAGDVNADLTLNYSGKAVNGRGIASLSALTYGKNPVGDFDLTLDVATELGGSIETTAMLDVNGKRTMEVYGALNDTTRSSPLDMKLKVSDFPLSVANPFLPREYARLSGSLNGLMDVSGTFTDTRLDGRVNFSDARIDVGMMGSAFTLDTVDIPVDSNLIRFNDFAILGSNSNPLKVNGQIDIRKFSDPAVSLNLTARNMQVIKSQKARNVELYGRGFIDLDATVRGNMRVLGVNADLAVLPLTNVTYQLTDARSTVGLQQTEEIVKFVNFKDTTGTVTGDSVVPSGMMMFLNANLDIRQGAQFTVDLSADGQNRAQVKANGILDYSMNPTQPDGRLTGRLNIDGGFFRYSLPVISEKLFTFTPGSYVAFNGPVMNPVLNIKAVDDIRANVTRPGENSRLIDFDVTLSASGTLDRMDVAFDLSTDDDISVSNELQSMSQTQRANQAMNLMLYGVYTGQGSTANANLSGNALYGFLTSQLNTWAANTIKGVDVSFGLDQYDSTRNGATQTTTQYSYKVSKSMFNDRFKIVVGGNYSTDADAEENLAQNLISDISVEYSLNDSGSMYIRLFRHTGFESILEGEITQTGVGFVVKRRIRRVSDIFNFAKAVKQ